MSVKIDPSEVRERSAASARNLPLRKIAFGGIGSLGLVAFAFGAFTFFEGLADPRARTPRPKPVAVNLPDLKDGIPALAPSTDASMQAAPPAPVLNLPRSPAPETQRATNESEPALRTSRQASADPVAAPAGPAAADSTGSVSSRPTSPARPTPQIENAQTVAPDAKAVPLIAPARAETVKAKPSDTRAVAALPPEPNAAQFAPAAKAPLAHAKAPEPKRVETKPVAPKPAPTKIAKAVPARPVVEASAEPAHASAPRAQAEESEGIVAGVKNGWNASVKAVGGMFGGE